MPKQDFLNQITSELDRLDQNKVSKRYERIITSFTDNTPPQAIIDGNPIHIFNSNDYLGLRFHPQLKDAEHKATQQYGTGPGAVRFISGSLKVYKDVEQAIAKFHGRDDAILFSSAFAANVAVLSCMLKGQTKDSLLSPDSLVISDELNHRSIIEGIRAASIAKHQKAIYRHLDAAHLDEILTTEAGNFDRVVVVTDGIFSMLGEYAPLDKLQAVIDKHDKHYPQGIVFIVDDAHGVGCFGKQGRGVEEVTNTHVDLLVGTFGKAFGADGGYIVGNQTLIDYLRESAATYIYSNNISPGTAGAALAAVQLMSSAQGQNILTNLQSNITQFKQLISKTDLEFAVNSTHPIQPLLIGDPQKTSNLTQKLFESGYLVTSINYPVVPPGRDEIRIQISASHTPELIDQFTQTLIKF